jgi:hypothetical protein
MSLLHDALFTVADDYDRRDDFHVEASLLILFGFLVIGKAD